MIKFYTSQQIKFVEKDVSIFATYFSTVRLNQDHLIPNICNKYDRVTPAKDQILSLTDLGN